MLLGLGALWYFAKNKGTDTTSGGDTDTARAGGEGGPGGESPNAPSPGYDPNGGPLPDPPLVFDTGVMPMPSVFST